MIWVLKAHTLYSMVDGSQQGVFGSLEKKMHAGSHLRCKKKKKKRKFSEFYWFLEVLTECTKFF